MSLSLISKEHRSGRRISRPKINWLIDYCEVAEIRATNRIINLLEEYEDTEDLVEVIREEL